MIDNIKNKNEKDKDNKQNEIHKAIHRTNTISWDSRHHITTKDDFLKESIHRKDKKSVHFVSQNRGSIKSVVDTGKNAKDSTRIQRPISAKTIRHVDIKSLPWNDPKTCMRRIPLVEKPPHGYEKKPSSSYQLKKAAITIKKEKEDNENKSSTHSVSELAKQMRHIHSVKSIQRVMERPNLLDSSIESFENKLERRKSFNLHIHDDNADTKDNVYDDDFDDSEDLNVYEFDELNDEINNTINIPFKEKQKKLVSNKKIPGYVTGLSIDMKEIAETKDKLFTFDDSFDSSYDLSASGTINVVGFQIKQTDSLVQSLFNSNIISLGTSRTPDKSSSHTRQENNIQKNLLYLDILGKGSGGTVYKALYIPTLQLVAVKVISVFEKRKRQQMISELQLLYNNLVPLSSEASGGFKTNYTITTPCPFIICFHDAFISPNNGTVSIVEEYMDGGSLQNLIDAGGCNSEIILAKISYGILQGLSFLHDNRQIHRDIKPANILINHKGDVKISDFGIIKDMENSIVEANTFVGTLTYMSPERISGEKYSFNSDIWSFGLTLMTLAMGHFPYEIGGNYWDIQHRIRNEPIPILDSNTFSSSFQDFISQCMTKEKEKRPNAKDLLFHPFLKNIKDEIENNHNIQPDIELINDENNIILKDVQNITLKLSLYVESIVKEKVEKDNIQYDQIFNWFQTLSFMHTIKIEKLANQMGIHLILIKKQFDEMVNELIKKLFNTNFIKFI